MPIYIEENTELAGNTFEIPKDLLKHLKKTSIKYGGNTKGNGYKRLQKLVNPSYNSRKGDKTSNLNGNRVSYGDLKRIDYDFRNSISDPVSYEMNGGDLMKNWVSDTLRRNRASVKPTAKIHKSESIKKSKVMPVKPNDPVKFVKKNI